MIKVELTEEIVRRLLRAYLRETPMRYPVGLAMIEAEKISRESFEREMAELAEHYAAE